MIGLIQVARVIAGSTLIVVGLVAIPLPVFPGIPLVIFGLTLGFTWHPRGLRLWRRSKVRWGRWIAARKAPRQGPAAG